MKLASLGAVAITTIVLLVTPVHAFGSKCRHYTNVPITVALSNGKAAALLHSRFYNYNRLRRHMGPHHYARLYDPRRKCRTRHSRYRSLK